MKINLGRFAGIAAAMTLAAFSQSVCAQTQGVSATEILVGTIQDLSGPLASYGKDVRNGLDMRAAEANAQGGIHGRKIKLLVEDNGYDPKRAVLAAQKLVSQDKVFVMAGALGTPTVSASLPVILRAGVVSFLPMGGTRGLYDPLQRLSFALTTAYDEQLIRVIPYLYHEKKATKACLLYQDDDLGREVLLGAERGLKSINVELAERTSYKRGATDFSSQMARLKVANCDFVVLGTVIRETVGAIQEARKIGYNPTLLAATSAYTDQVPKLGGAAMDGLYANMFAEFPYGDDKTPLAVLQWMTKYRAVYSDPPTIMSIYGYVIMDRLIDSLQRAGPRLNTDTLVSSIETLNTPQDIFGLPAMRMSATDHLAISQTRVSQLKDGRWRVVWDYGQIK